MNFCPNCGGRLKAVSAAIGRMIDDFRKKLAERPQDADAHYNLALAYLTTAEINLAERELLQVIELEPDFPDARVRLAELYLRRGNCGEARAQLARVLAGEPDNSAAAGLLAQCPER
jgi:predicted Zn-dependent protease